MNRQSTLLVRNILFPIALVFLAMSIGCVLADDMLLDKLEIIRDRQLELLSIVRSFQEKIFAGFTLAIGWLITSRDAREYLAEQKFVRRILLMSVFMLFLMTQLTLFDYYMASEKLYSMLESSDIVFDSATDTRTTAYKFTSTNLVVTFLFSFVLYIVLSALIFRQNPNR